MVEKQFHFFTGGIQQMVDGNAVKPGFKLAFSIEGFQMRHNFDQHLLSSIQGIVGMGKQAQ